MTRREAVVVILAAVVLSFVVYFETHRADFAISHGAAAVLAWASVFAIIFVLQWCLR